MRSHAEVSEPSRSMPRTPSSTTTTSKPSRRASRAEDCTQTSVARPERKPLGEAVDDGDDLVAPGDGQRTSGTEVVLDVDGDERVFGPQLDPLRHPSTLGEWDPGRQAPMVDSRFRPEDWDKDKRMKLGGG